MGMYSNRRKFLIVTEIILVVVVLYVAGYFMTITPKILVQCVPTGGNSTAFEFSMVAASRIHFEDNEHYLISLYSPMIKMHRYVFPEHWNPTDEDVERVMSLPPEELTKILWPDE